VKPNVTWPDVVYYHSYTTPYMGWKIHVVDNFRNRPRFKNSGFSCQPTALATLVAAFILTKLLI
jgi:hypothetical protein